MKTSYIVLAIIVAAVGWYYWKNSSNPTGGGTAQLNSAVQQDLAYYQAWNDAQQQTQNTPTPSQPTYGPGQGGPVQAWTTQSQAMMLPAGV